MKILNYLAVAAVCLSSTTHVHAEEATALTVTTINGTARHFALYLNPAISFAEGKLTVRTDDKNTAEFELSALRDITYTSGFVGIEDAAVLAPDSYSVADDVLTIAAAGVRRDVSLAAVNGIVLASFAVPAGQGADISLSGYAPGAYILTVNKKSAKIVLQ